MGFFKILPAAAGIIALTATVSFARDQRECEEGDICRTSIAECSSPANTPEISNKPAPAAGNGSGKNMYQVAVTRGTKSWLVYVDAYSGKVLDKRNI